MGSAMGGPFLFLGGAVLFVGALRWVKWRVGL